MSEEKRVCVDFVEELGGKAQEVGGGAVVEGAFGCVRMVGLGERENGGWGLTLRVLGLGMATHCDV